jgi:hypothetical protein
LASSKGLRPTSFSRTRSYSAMSVKLTLSCRSRLPD